VRAGAKPPLAPNVTLFFSRRPGSYDFRLQPVEIHRIPILPVSGRIIAWDRSGELPGKAFKRGRHRRRQPGDPAREQTKNEQE
jgi:hypothetical protein